MTLNNDFATTSPVVFLGQRLGGAAIFALAAVLIGCGQSNAPDAQQSQQQPANEESSMQASTSVTESVFGTLPDGTEVKLFTLTNSQGVEAKIMTYGGIVTSLRVPDRDGELGNVVLGFDELAPYVEGDGTPYFGALIGRFGNRIAEGKFTIDGETYQLDTNDGANHLHGGVQGFDKKVWDAEPFQNDTGAGLEMSLLSPDGDQGYPGNLQVTAIYTLTNDNALEVEFKATSDKATPVNLTQHSYFNLAGEGKILDHNLMIDASHFTPIDSTLIPTGELRPVEGTPFDFRSPTKIGARIDADNQQLAYGQGYDHNFVLDKEQQGAFELAARVVEPDSGRVLEVFTEEPAIQFYSGNFLDGSLTGRNGVTYEHRSGFCLEPQHFPDAPNQPDFPSTILRPGEEYSTRLSFAFSTVDASQPE